MRGGTSKGVFYKLDDLPVAAQVPGSYRDEVLLRVIGSPDPYAKHTDGMGGATSSTSKSVILSKSTQAGHDVDYLFGQVAIDKPFVDWSGNCGNLTAAVGSFAINNGLVDAARIPENGVCEVRIWQQNIGKTILASVPITNGQVQETGDFMLDGVTFPAAEVPIAFVAPVESDEAVFPTGQLVDTLVVPDEAPLEVTMINSGIPTLFFRAEDLGYTGTELQEAINGDVNALTRLEKIRLHGAVHMGLSPDIETAQTSQHIPKIAFVSEAKSYTTSSGAAVSAEQIDLHVRALSMGKLHHAMMGTAAVAIGTAAAIPGTIVNLAAGGGELTDVTFGHPSGTLKVGAKATQNDSKWEVEQVTMSRSARVLMEGWVRIPEPQVK
ncbi:2-methylaconitate cis-trans isomerase PrpF [Alteromonas sp. LMIT007]|uniref:2-methylaconitate cis-trans isomerase PrpF n=2 Tax=Opacimonas viscosa TaxID=2961944 RepID=A0AA42BN85_9ALTE|nr:2-methylaconitate cis-trans isomerase PrpF [Opacimonas viscosa]